LLDASSSSSTSSSFVPSFDCRVCVCGAARTCVCSPLGWMFLQPYFMVSHYCRASKIVGVSVEFVSAFGGRKKMAIFFVDNMIQVRPRNGNKNVGLTWYIREILPVSLTVAFYHGGAFSSL